MNMIEGHAFLRKEFGIVPKIVWHPDDFGHSAATPDLYAKMGFEAVFFARDDDDEKGFRRNF